MSSYDPINRLILAEVMQEGECRVADFQRGPVPDDARERINSVEEVRAEVRAILDHVRWLYDEAPDSVLITGDSAPLPKSSSCLRR
jgi:hypothetical protein